MTKDVSADLFAALLAGVQRHDPQWYGPHDSGRYVLLEEVLAALAAAVPDDLAEAEKVLEGVTPGKWEPHHHDEYSELAVYHPEFTGLGHFYEAADANFIAWCREGVPALLARIAAQEAQIKGLHEMNNGLSDMFLKATDRTKAAKTALAASEARVAKLVEALTFYSCKDGCNDCSENERDLSGCGWTARAAITEAGQ